mgnify:FL=1
MNIALIFAGGIGKRMNVTGIPKQFLKLYGKEIIIYTLEIFENNKNIDIFSMGTDYIFGPIAWR